MSIQPSGENQPYNLPLTEGEAIVHAYRLRLHALIEEQKPEPQHVDESFNELIDAGILHGGSIDILSDAMLLGVGKEAMRIFIARRKRQLIVADGLNAFNTLNTLADSLHERHVEVTALPGSEHRAIVSTNDNKTHDHATGIITPLSFVDQYYIELAKTRAIGVLPRSGMFHVFPFDIKTGEPQVTLTLHES